MWEIKSESFGSIIYYLCSLRPLPKVVPFAAWYIPFQVAYELAISFPLRWNLLHNPPAKNRDCITASDSMKRTNYRTSCFSLHGNDIIHHPVARSHRAIIASTAVHWLLQTRDRNFTKVNAGWLSLYTTI